MARRKSAVLEVEAEIEVVTPVEVITPVEVAPVIYNMGEFEITPYAERRYTGVYYGLREMYGQVVKKTDLDFDWEVFNAKFEECFGKLEDRKYSLEELSEFAREYFDKSIEEVVEYNRKSLNRRKEYEVKDIEMPKPKVPVAIDYEDIPY
jgi:hypothetical protein